MAYKPSSLVQRVWSAPPQCLANLRAEPSRELPAGTTEWWDERMNSPSFRSHVYAARSRCTSSATPIRSPPFTCSARCRSSALIAHVSPLCSISKSTGTMPLLATVAGPCVGMVTRNDGSAPSAPALPSRPTAFSYQLEAEDFEPEQQARIQDFFDGFGLDVRCDRCGIMTGLVGYECA
jgi:hypothetical protein